MAERETHSVQTDVATRATESMLGPNPFVGFSREDVLDAWVKVLDSAISQPTSVVINSASFVMELLRVLIGTSELAPEKGDKRFTHQRFSTGKLYRRAMQSYLAAVKALNNWLEDLELDPKHTARARFMLSLMTDAMAPTNTVVGNPDALQKLIDTRGRSGLKGIRNLIQDMRKNNFMPSQVDKSKFAVGENLACTPGRVVFRNHILELIQYDPQTPAVHAIPFVFAPPQINKYYVLDLSPPKSLLRYLVENGFQVFAISWRNPTKSDAQLGMDDYVRAMREAINAILCISGEERVNMLGVCAGGITTTIAAAHFSAIGDYCINSLSLLVTVLDTQHEEDTTLGLFITPETIELARQQSAVAGVLKGEDTARLFSWLRPNDLVWNYWVNNYLLGNDPPAFDVLFWNSDTTNLPARLHSHFLDLYVDNALAAPGPAEIAGMPIDLGMIESDIYIVGGTTDHITPWKATYRNIGLFGGEVTYVLSHSGHIQCMVNPPGNPKASFATNASQPPSASDFLEGAEQHQGSWWPYWVDWLAERSGEQVDAPRERGGPGFPPLEKAPGTYVML